MSNNLTSEEIEYLKDAVQSGDEKEWNAACAQIRRNHNGYPDDWYQKVILGGIIPDDTIRIVSTQNKE